MKNFSRPCLILSGLLGGCFLLTGCFSLKPVEDPARYYVLAPLANPPAPADGQVDGTELGVGIGPVTLASYLEDNRLAVRRDGHEIIYADHLLWAERLEKAVPRILAINLARLLGSSRIQTGSWGREDVGFELHVTLHRFEWEESGQTALAAQWQVRRPGSATMAASGLTQLQGDGPALSVDPEGAVGALNDLLNRMSRQVAARLEALAKQK